MEIGIEIAIEIEIEIEIGLRFDFIGVLCLFVCSSVAGRH